MYISLTEEQAWGDPNFPLPEYLGEIQMIDRRDLPSSVLIKTTKLEKATYLWWCPARRLYTTRNRARQQTIEEHIDQTSRLWHFQREQEQERVNVYFPCTNGTLVLIKKN